MRRLGDSRTYLRESLRAFRNRGGFAGAPSNYWSQMPLPVALHVRGRGFAGAPANYWAQLAQKSVPMTWVPGFPSPRLRAQSLSGWPARGRRGFRGLGDGAAGASCSTDSDCGQGLLCYDGDCLPAAGVLPSGAPPASPAARAAAGALCSADSDCGPGLLCFDGDCLPPAGLAIAQHPAIPAVTQTQPSPPQPKSTWQQFTDWLGKETFPGTGIKNGYAIAGATLLAAVMSGRGRRR